MPTLIVENVPMALYECLRKRATAERRSVPEEMLHLLEQLLREDAAPAPRLPDFVPSEEISAPCDLPRSSQPVAMRSYNGSPRWPDPCTEEAPE